MWNNNPNMNGYPQPQQLGMIYGQPQPLTMSMVPGKRINNPQEITVRDVPQDGSIALFMTQDNSAIYARAWNSKGTIDEVKYVPEQPIQTTQNSSPEEMLPAILKKLEGIEKRLNSYHKKPYYKKTSEKTEVKEETPDE